MGRVLLVCLAASLSSCLYFNTWWNGKKAYDQAEKSRTGRLRKNPDDTTKVNQAETDLYKRAIVKGAKILETFPEDTLWHDRALMLIARAQQRLYEYENASRKYGELIDAFPWSPQYTPAVQGKIECLLALGRYSEAEDWMRHLDSVKAEGGAAGLLWLKARVALGRLDTLKARGHLKKLVAMRDVVQPRHGEAAWLLGTLSWAQEDWLEARNAYLHKAIEGLPRLQRFRARLRAGLALDRQDKLDDARLELAALAQEKQFAREKPYVHLEAARMLAGHRLYGDAHVQFRALEKYIEPVEAVAEGMLMDGQDAQLRRVDYDEALRLFEISAKTGPATEFGKKAHDLADALAELIRLRKQKVADTAWSDWTFSLAELHLLRLDNADSARAAYGRILTRPGASLAMRARAAYAIAWIDDGRDTGAAGTSRAWQSVVDSFPGTEFAKQAQKNGGIAVTVVTRADSAESDYRLAESLWDTATPDYAGADSAFRKLARDWPETESGKRARFACAWIEDNLLNDTAAAKVSYKWVVDSLPGTAWARKAGILLDALRTGPEAIEFQLRPDHMGRRGMGGSSEEEDFEEGQEKVEGIQVPKAPGLGPQKPKAPGLLAPDEPDAIPPTPEGGYLSPDDFQ
jgi:tetratricopeptide (TPR) repeat protein